MASKPKMDPWRWPAFALWLVFLLVGFAPGAVFRTLRELAWVTTQDALVNSEYILTIAAMGYVAFFTLERCREAGLSAMESQAKAVQLGVLAMIAFLPITDVTLRVTQIPIAEYRRIVYIVSAGKFLAWLYLLSIVVRYYFFGRYAVFANMLTVFPSAAESSQNSANSGSPLDAQNKQDDAPTHANQQNSHSEQ